MPVKVRLTDKKLRSLKSSRKGKRTKVYDSDVDGLQRVRASIHGDDLEADVDTVIAACGGSMRAAIRALLIANEFLSAELKQARERQSVG